MATTAQVCQDAPPLDMDAPISVVCVVGEQDYTTAAELRDRLACAAAQNPMGCVVVDLAGVTFMDCAGLRPLREARVQLGNRLRLRAVPRPVRRLLALTGLQTTFGADITPVGVLFHAAPGHKETS